jgi:oxygen-independent coproporphyrinogen-3 oxidase
LTVEKGTLLHEYFNSPHPNPGSDWFDFAKKGSVSGKREAMEEDQIIEMYEYAINYLKTEGYIHYEISNFSTPGFSCRHNINYWDSGDYYGVGQGAHSHLNRTRFNNTENLEEYINLLSHGMNPVKNEEEITPEKALSEVFFLGLRKADGVEMKKLSEALGRDVSVAFGKEIAEFEEIGLMEVYDKGSRIRLTRKGLCLSNEVFIKFM